MTQTTLPPSQYPTEPSTPVPSFHPSSSPTDSTTLFPTSSTPTQRTFSPSFSSFQPSQHPTKFPYFSTLPTHSPSTTPSSSPTLSRNLNHLYSLNNEGISLLIIIICIVVGLTIVVIIVLVTGCIYFKYKPHTVKQYENSIDAQGDDILQSNETERNHAINVFGLEMCDNKQIEGAQGYILAMCEQLENTNASTQRQELDHMHLQSNINVTNISC
eukprot:709319_1